MRIWDIAPRRLCRPHLLGEHRELHAIWAVITKRKKGYARHPETVRWYGRLKALYQRHARLVDEMERRGYRHKSPLNAKLATGASRQTIYVDSVKRQMAILKAKKCGCRLG
jgi:hypothetical protein